MTIGVLSRSLNQTATYWGNPVADGLGGFSFDTPVEISCRWERRSVQFENPFGDTEVSAAVVYIGQEVDLNGYLYLGSSVAADPADVDDAFIIKQYSEIPDLRNLSAERKAYL